MTTSSAAIFLIVVAAGAAIFFLAKIGWAAAGKRRQGRHVQADKLREAAKQETRRVRRQEVLVTRRPLRRAPSRTRLTSRLLSKPPGGGDLP